MDNDASYHEAVIYYNEQLGKAAADLAKAPELSNSKTVQKWCRAIAQQHRVHAARHKSLLKRLQDEGNDSMTENDSSQDLSDDEVRRLDAITDQNATVQVHQEPDAAQEPARVDAAPDAEQAAEPVPQTGADVGTDETEDESA